MNNIKICLFRQKSTEKSIQKSFLIYPFITDNSLFIMIDELLLTRKVRRNPIKEFANENVQPINIISMFLTYIVLKLWLAILITYKK